MKKLTKKSVLLIPLLLASLAGGWALNATSASANSGWGGRGHGPAEGHRMQRMAIVLGLSTEQQTQIEKIMENERQTVAPLLDQLRTSREELRKAALASTFDEAAVRNIAAAQASTRTELIVARAHTRNLIHAVLTPEQQALAEKLRLARGPRGPHGGAPGPDGPEL